MAALHTVSRIPRRILITDPADPRIADYANLKDHRLRALDFAGERPTFIGEGAILARRLLAMGAPIRSLLASPAWLDAHETELAPLAGDTPVYAAPDAVLESLTGFAFHRGVLACAERPPALDAHDLIARARLLVILEDLANQDNVGAVFRNTAALAGDGAAVLLSPGCCDPLYRKALRVSMGASLAIPFARLTPWPDALARVQAAGFTLVALTPHPAARDIRSLAPGEIRRPALLLGAEGPGLSPAASARAGLRVRIPMSGLADSLNVAVAAGIALDRLSRPFGEPCGVPGV